MATIQVNGAPVTSSSTRNNGGAAKRVKNTYLLDGLSVSGSTVGFVGSKVVVGVNTFKGLASGVFGYNSNAPVAKRYSITLSGYPNSVLRSGALVPSLIKGVHKVESVITLLQTTAIRAGKLNLYTGKFDVGYPELSNDTGTSGTGKMLVDSSGQYRDTATKSPGRLTFRTGSKLPVNNSYEK
jgi:hypothetical protein